MLRKSLGVETIDYCTFWGDLRLHASTLDDPKITLKAGSAVTPRMFE